jgi:hypothetical protein
MGSSCSKDDDDVTIPIVPPVTKPVSNSDYFLTDSANYWIYETYKVDTNNNETFESRDTVTVRNVVINGVEYMVYNMRNPIGSNRNKSDVYMKDSSGYIVNRYGSRKVFSATDLNRVIAIDSMNPNFYITEYMMVKDSVPLVVPAGSFTEALTYQGKVRAVNGGTSNYPEIRYSKKSYATGVGLAFEKFFYFSTGHFHYERRLVDYHVNRTVIITD